MWSGVSLKGLLLILATLSRLERLEILASGSDDS